MELGKIRRKKIYKWYKDFKKTLSCSKCPESNTECIQFHHKYNKKSEIGMMAKVGYSKEAILNEIKKCEIVCANCHMKIHELELKNWS